MSRSSRLRRHDLTGTQARVLQRAINLQFDIGQPGNFWRSACTELRNAQTPRRTQMVRRAAGPRHLQGLELHLTKLRLRNLAVQHMHQSRQERHENSASHQTAPGSHRHMANLFKLPRHRQPGSVFFAAPMLMVEFVGTHRNVRIPA